MDTQIGFPHFLYHFCYQLVAFSGVVKKNKRGESLSVRIPGFGQEFLCFLYRAAVFGNAIGSGCFKKVTSLIIRKSGRDKTGGRNIPSGQSLYDFLPVNGVCQGFSHSDVLPHIQIHIEVVVIGSQKRINVEFRIFGYESGDLCRGD